MTSERQSEGFGIIQFEILRPDGLMQQYSSEVELVAPRMGPAQTRKLTTSPTTAIDYVRGRGGTHLSPAEAYHIRGVGTFSPRSVEDEVNRDMQRHQPEYLRAAVLLADDPETASKSKLTVAIGPDALDALVRKEIGEDKNMETRQTSVYLRDPNRLVVKMEDIAEADAEMVPFMFGRLFDDLPPGMRQGEIRFDNRNAIVALLLVGDSLGIYEARRPTTMRTRAASRTIRSVEHIGTGQAAGQAYSARSVDAVRAA